MLLITENWLCSFWGVLAIIIGYNLNSILIIEFWYYGLWWGTSNNNFNLKRAIVFFQPNPFDSNPTNNIFFIQKGEFIP